MRKPCHCGADFLRHILLSWLIAATIEFLLLPGSLRELSSLEGLAQMSFGRLIGITLAGTAVLWLLSLRWNIRALERWGMVSALAILSVTAVCGNFNWAFLSICVLVLAVFIVYAIWGWNDSFAPVIVPQSSKKVYIWGTAALSIGFFLFVSIWTVCRVLSFCTPTYDFGIFSQMFHSMKQTGLPMTTLERDGLLSHFQVHMSPIYYLLLPFYCLYPTPATLQVLQAGVLASAVIPLWKLGKHHGLSGLQRMLLCAVLLLYPAVAGGTSYDIHENCFLLPLILWLLYGIDRQNFWMCAVAGLLVLTVKEDAAVYVAVIALYWILRTVLRYNRAQRKTLIAGVVLLFISVVWFFLVTTFLAQAGDGVMTYRYSNFLYGNSSSLLTVIEAVLVNPMKMLLECTDREKLVFIAQTILPLLGLPLFTRKFERYILLIPYVLINLMSDYQYQHDIFFQYTFGSTACLVYLTLVNLADLRQSRVRLFALAAAVLVSGGFFLGAVVPKASPYPRYVQTYSSRYRQMEQTLAQIPQDASVTATTFYTTYLSQRDILYDLRYCSKEHLLSTEYVALCVSATSDYKKYARSDASGFDSLVALLEANGYVLFAEMPGEMVIYRKN